jgi:CheY-like chemotaxis protein
MRVLLVEDKVDFAQSVDRAVTEIPNCELVWARSRDSALAHVEGQDFDLIILDRKIPSADDVLDDSVEHGFRVFQAARESAAGTPIWFLTATEDADFAAEIGNNHASTADLHGRGELSPLVLVLWKKKLDEAVRRVRTFAQHQAELEAIAIQNAGGINFAAAEERNLRIFARMYGASSLEVTALGGLSGARVLKVVALNAGRGVIHTAVAKIGAIATVHDEHGRFQRDISRLQQGGYPSLSVKIDAGSAGIGGLYYGMVGPDVTSLFTRLAAGEDLALNISTRLRGVEKPWLDGKTNHTVTVGEIRRKFLKDTRLPEIAAELQGFEIAPVEAVQVGACKCAQHNDLHGENIVFDAGGIGMVIDYNDTGPSFASVDPVTLELSVIFHKNHKMLGTAWPAIANMQAWPELDRYLQDCPFPTFVSQCREWALAAANTPDEVLAVAYGYAMRQLKYQDTRKDLARALIQACAAALIAPKAA